MRLYEEMPDPKYVIAMGACTITGGMFSSDSHNAVRGVDKLIPVDVYIPGCPPRPEAIFDAIIKLRKKVSNETIQERSTVMEQTHRYYSTPHNMKAVSPDFDWEIFSHSYPSSTSQGIDRSDRYGSSPRFSIPETEGGSIKWLTKIHKKTPQKPKKKLRS